MLLDGICEHNMQKSHDLWHCFKSDPLEMSHSQSESTFWNLISISVTFLPSQTTDINVWTCVLLLLIGGPVRQETHSWMDRWAMLLWINLDCFDNYLASLFPVFGQADRLPELCKWISQFTSFHQFLYLIIYRFTVFYAIKSAELYFAAFFPKLLSLEIPSHSRDLTNICFSCLPISSSGLILPCFTL